MRMMSAVSIATSVPVPIVKLTSAQHVPKHMDTFAGQSFDRVVILCDREEEKCPTWLGSPQAIQWSYPDPLAVEGTEEEQQRAFDQLAVQLNLRVRLFLTLLEREQKEARPSQEL